MSRSRFLFPKLYIDILTLARCNVCVGEVKNFHLYSRPKIGDVITTTITMGPEVEGITIIRGTSTVNGVTVADTSMKIFIKD